MVEKRHIADKKSSLPADRWFMMDPEFPSRLMRHSPESPIEAFKYCAIFLIESYSKRQLTFANDRPIAMAGLEQRIAEAFACESRFGVFNSNLHYNLLWTSVGDKPLELRHDQDIPSWSWMSYPCAVHIQKGMGDFSGGLLKRFSVYHILKKGIKEGYAGTLGLEVNSNVSFHPGSKNHLNAELATLVDCTIRAREKEFLGGLGPEFNHVISSVMANHNIGYISFDAQTVPDFDDLYCIVIARVNVQFLAELDGIYYLFLVIEPIDKCGEYRRVGVGMAHIEHVTKLNDIVHIV